MQACLIQAQVNDRHAEGKLLELRTGCRLHFGLMELCPSSELCYAGLGLMLNRPGWWFRFDSQQKPENECPVDATGNSPVLVHVPVQAHAETDRRIAHVLSLPGPLLTAAASKLDVRVLSPLPLHGGLGAGTQLACGVAVGRCWLTSAERISELQDRRDSTLWQTVGNLFPALDPPQLARLAGRGLRSAIGLQGFLSGGLVLDLGYHPAPPAGTDAPSTRAISTQHYLLPHPWRVVLIRPSTEAAVAGQRETTLIDQLSRQPHRRAERMLQLAQQVIHQLDDLASFAATIDEYMHWAGEMFAPIQGGLYNGSKVEAAVGAARRTGLLAVGQSSWGPTVFGFAASPEQAEWAVTRLRIDGSQSWSVTIAQPAQHGAELRWSDSQLSR